MPVQNRFPSSVATREGLSVLEKNLIIPPPLHWHDFYEIEYIKSGSGYCVINDQQYPIQENMLFFMTPLDSQLLIFENPLKTVTIMFTEEWILNEVKNFLTGPGILRAFPFPDASRMAAECNTKNPYNYLYLKERLNCLLIDVARSIQHTGAVRTYSEPIQNALFYIQSNIYGSLDFNDVAQKVGLSPQYFCRLFHKSVGKTYTEYINALRLDHAAKLLLHTEHPVSEVYRLSGFGSLAHFMRCFKEKYLISPYQYRKHHQAHNKALDFERPMPYFFDSRRLENK